MPIFHNRDFIPKTTDERIEHEKVILHLEFFPEVISDEERSQKA
jgi:hypothetical protein